MKIRFAMIRSHLDRAVEIIYRLAETFDFQIGLSSFNVEHIRWLHLDAGSERVNRLGISIFHSLLNPFFQQFACRYDILGFLIIFIQLQ